MKELVDGFVSVIGGANDAVDPILLQNYQYARGLNCSSRGGLLKTRPMWKRVATLRSGTYQRGYMYRLNSEDRIVYSVDGNIYGVRLSDLTEDSYGLKMSPSADRCFFVKADEFLIVQDGESTPLIIKGDSVFDEYIDSTDHSLGKFQEHLPIGTIMAYGHGRLFLVPKYVPDNNGEPTTEDGRPYFLAGDIIKPYRKTDILRFTETNYLAEGGAMGLPSEFGFINALIFFRNAQTSTGLGTLIVMARDGMGSFSVNAPRDQWKSIDLSTILFTDSGTESPDGPIAVNDDIIYPDSDGLHTIRYQVSTTANSSGTLSNPVISAEVNYLFRMNQREDYPYISSAYANNRVFFTCGGRNADGTFKAISSLDVDTTHQITAIQPVPAYDGMWSGLSFYQLFRGLDNGMENVYAIVKNGTANELWKIDESAYRDGASTKTLCRNYTRAMVHPDQYNGIKHKMFQYAILNIKDIVGDCDVTIYWRADGYKLWNKTRTHPIKADSSGIPQRRYQIKLTPISDTCDDTIDQFTRVGETFQYCVEWHGKMTIQSIKFYAMEKADPEPDSCGDEDTTKLESSSEQVELDDFSYTIS